MGSFRDWRKFQKVSGPHLIDLSSPFSVSVSVSCISVTHSMRVVFNPEFMTIPCLAMELWESCVQLGHEFQSKFLALNLPQYLLVVLSESELDASNTEELRMFLTVLRVCSSILNFACSQHESSSFPSSSVGVCMRACSVLTSRQLVGKLSAHPSIYAVLHEGDIMALLFQKKTQFQNESGPASQVVTCIREVVCSFSPHAFP
jgi:hypothetical protein